MSQPRFVGRNRSANSRRIARAFKVLQGLYAADPYLPIVRSRADRALAGFWDIALVPLTDRLPVFARVAPHTDGKPRGELRESFFLAHEWLREVWPEALESGEACAHLWVFGYIPGPNRPRTPGWITKQGENPSVLCGWRFSWHRRKFVNDHSANFWVGEAAYRVTIPHKWSSEPQRAITHGRQKVTKAEREAAAMRAKAQMQRQRAAKALAEAKRPKPRD